MKNIFLIMLGSAVCFLPGFSQNINMKLFGEEGFDRGMFISQTADNGYILCGYSSSFGESADIYVVKTDEEANLQWQKNYGGNLFDMGWGIYEMKDGGYLLMGEVSISPGNSDIRLLRLDSEGNVTWQKDYGGKTYERATQLIPTSDNHLLLIGQRNIDSTNIDSYILKIDTAGNLLWEKTFGGSFIERTFYGAETPAGDFLITGLILPYNNNKADILLVKITTDGNLLWIKTYGDKDVHDIAHSFGLNKDQKRYTLSGYTESGIAGYHDGLFMQLDDEGNILVKKKHASHEDLRLMHAEQTNDGHFIVTGFTRKDITTSLWDAVLLKFDADGETLWTRTFGKPEKEDQGYWVIENKNNGYTLTGFTHSFGKNGDLWIIRTDANGNTP